MKLLIIHNIHLEIITYSHSFYNFFVTLNISLNISIVYIILKEK